MVLTQLLLMLLVDKHMVTLHLLLIITGDLFWCNQTKRELLLDILVKDTNEGSNVVHCLN